MLYTILVIVLILALVGGLPIGPWWGSSGHSYGWGPSGIVGVLLIVLVVLLLTGRL